MPERDEVTTALHEAVALARLAEERATLAADRLRERIEARPPRPTLRLIIEGGKGRDDA